MKDGKRTRIIVSDDFEKGIIKSPTYDLYGKKTGVRLHAEYPRLRAYLGGADPQDKAGIFVTGDTAASGKKSVRIQNSKNMSTWHLPCLSWWFYNDEIIKSGTLKISFDLLIPEKGNPLGVGARMFQGTKGFSKHRQDAFQVFIEPDKVSFLELQKNKQNKEVRSLPVKAATWNHYELILPIRDTGGEATLKVTGPDGNSREMSIPYKVPFFAVDWIGFMMAAQQDNHLFLDNLDIRVENELIPVPKPVKVVEEEEKFWEAAPAELLDVFPKSSVKTPEKEKGKTVFKSSYYPSGSTWLEGLDERWVFHKEIKHQQGDADSFALRIGKGGQIYSLRGKFGESVPPSYRSDGPSSPWNDEVWQFVAICSKYNDTLEKHGKVSEEVKKRIKKTKFPRLHYFVHNSGAYMESGLEVLDNLYCPMLASAETKDGRAYRTVNWGFIPWHTPHRSPLLYYVQTRDLGNGIIEITYVVHNFSVRKDVVFDWLNAPWGGTRASSLPFYYLSNPQGGLRGIKDLFKDNDTWNKPVKVRDTGGWNLSCASEKPDSPSLALVFGRDKHLEKEQDKKKKGEPYLQYAESIFRNSLAYSIDEFLGQNIRERPENTWRNYNVAVVIPKFKLRPGETIWYRSYLVINRKDKAIELAKSLVDHVDYGLLKFDPAKTPLVPVYIKNAKVVKESKSAKPAFKLYAKPIPGSKPLFLIENAKTGREVITTDMYIFFDKEKLDWQLPKEHPDAEYYNNAYAYRLEKHNSKWKRLLGYGLEKKPKGKGFVKLSQLLDKSQFPEKNRYHLDLWVRK